MNEDDAKIVGKTDRSITAYACAPWRRLVDDAKVLLHAVGARGRVGHDMGGGGLAPLDLDEAFGADGMVAASRMVYVWGIVLADMT